MIPGLSFLSPFGKLKSFAHAQIVPKYIDGEKDGKVEYNPIFAQFENGIKDSYSLNLFNSYSPPPSVDLLLYAIESLYKRALKVGDITKGVIDFLDEGGRAQGFEGLGSVEVQLKHLQSVFPPSIYFVQQTSKLPAGLTSSIKLVLDNYAKFSQAVIYSQLPGTSLKTFLDWSYLLSSKIEQLLDVIKAIGIGSRSFIPNISFKNYQFEKEKLVGFLSSLGFRDSEIEKLLNVNSFSELIDNFAPLSDSSDLKSFFKAYELSQLIYEFAGDEGISSYLSFLYSINPIDSLLNILSLTQKDPSKITSVQLSKYPKLIGLLIGLTYAIDPSQVIKFNQILRGNNLTLLQSIQFLYQSGQKTIIKSREEIDLLNPVIEQIVRGFYDDPDLSPSLNYHQANSEAPIALKQWTDLLSQNLGNLKSPFDIEHLYDKSVGLTPKELISVLNYPNSTNNFSGLIDGFEGGEFTRFIKYANLSGLGVKLGYYKNSYQVNNFKTNLDSKYAGIYTLVSSLDELLESIKLMNVIFENSLVFKPSELKVSTDFTDSLVFAQNKNYEAFPIIFNEIKNNPLVDKFLSPESVRNIKNTPILESPGIGNSRIPNRVPAVNTISPEQAQALSGVTQNSSLPSQINNPVITPTLINNFIKFSDPNKFVNTINQTNEVNEPPRVILSAEELQNTRLPVSEFESLNPIFAVPQKQYIVPEVYKKTPLDEEVKSQTLGVNYLSKSYSYEESISEKFDPVKSCEQFGGENCSELYENSAGKCARGINKSLLPEDYSRIPGSDPNRVYVDRPLGTFADYKPSKQLIPSSSFASPPAYFGLLPETAIPGNLGEPLINEKGIRDPVVFKTGNGAVSEYNNTEFAIVEFIRAKLERNTEFECASFNSPFEYQTCMNIMKCKRFVAPFTDEYYLSFCPKTLAGGRPKP
jgi:hypothetical protein